MSLFFIWGSGRFILFRSSVTSRLGGRQPSLSFPLFVADKRSGYVFVLDWFFFSGDFGLISIPCSFLHTKPSV